MAVEGGGSRGRENRKLRELVFLCFEVEFIREKTKKTPSHHVDLHRRGLADLAVPGGVVVVVDRDGALRALGLLHAQEQAVDELGAEALGALAQEVVHDLAAAHADVLGLGQSAAVFFLCVFRFGSGRERGR